MAVMRRSVHKSTFCQCEPVTKSRSDANALNNTKPDTDANTNPDNSTNNTSVGADATHTFTNAHQNHVCVTDDESDELRD